MTTGIYKLNFKGTDRVYIGQSSNIERRISEHLRDLCTGVSAAKLQDAYNTYGEPSYEVLCEGSLSELDSLETEAIEIFDSVDNGFNTLYHPGCPDIRGMESSNTKYSKQAYIEIYSLLYSGNTIRNVAKLTGTTNDIVSKISLGLTHQWLATEYPHIHAFLEQQKKFGRYGNNVGISEEDRRIASPTGEVYVVFNIREFARDNSLDASHLASVLSGKRKSHKKWTKI